MYLECVQLFLVNDIAMDKQVSVLLTLVGPKVYELLHSSALPNFLQEKTFKELVELLKRHYEPQPIVIAERFCFHHRNQVTNENIAQYLVELRRLALTVNSVRSLREPYEIACLRLVQGEYEKSLECTLITTLSFLLLWRR